MLGETGELAAAIQTDIDEFIYFGIPEKTEKLFGSLSGETDRAKKYFHKIKSIRWFQETRGTQSRGLGGGARLGLPRRVRK
jgi:hypothetical protein